MRERPALAQLLGRVEMTGSSDSSRTDESHGQSDSDRTDGRSQAVDRLVLVVEDHEPTARIIATTVEAAGSSISVSVAGNGKEALIVLRGEMDTPRPDLVLLDLDLPVLDGLGVLETRKKDSALRDIPTVVVSGTGDQDMIDECYERGANAFIAKPDNLDEYSAMAKGLVDFWLSVDGPDETAERGENSPHE